MKYVVFEKGQQLEKSNTSFTEILSNSRSLLSNKNTSRLRRKKGYYKKNRYRKKLNPVKPKNNILIKFEHFSARKPFFKSENKFAPIYYPNVNYCRKRTNNLCLGFEKTSGRGNIFDTGINQNLNTYNPPKRLKTRNRSVQDLRTLNSSKCSSRGPFSRHKSSIQSLRSIKLNPVKHEKNPLVSLSKVQPRFKNPKSILPCFMQTGSDGSRFSLNLRNEKALRENCYGDVTGKKDKAKLFRRKKRRDEDEESIDSISDISLFDTAVALTRQMEREIEMAKDTITQE